MFYFQIFIVIANFNILLNLALRALGFQINKPETILEETYEGLLDQNIKKLSFQTFSNVMGKVIFSEEEIINKVD